MGKKIARIVIAVAGAVIGLALTAGVDRVLAMMNRLLLHEAVYIAAAILSAIIFYILSPRIIELFSRLVGGIEARMSNMSLSDIMLGAFGLIVGLLIALLLSTLTSSLPGLLAFIINAVLYCTFGYLGCALVLKRRGEINFPSWFHRPGKAGKSSSAASVSGARPKVLDTSVIIDGRIADICQTGMLEGQLIVPAFVLAELRHIADSADTLKRNRGRRGLDILNRMQKEQNIPIKVVDTDYEDIAEVDAKLIRLAYDMGGVVVTNDYNLNKVAGVQRVPVFNINELANALKPMVLPGEEMMLTIVKEGKEYGQGVGYLNDGTMIVVDGGKRYIGEEVAVIVTSALQTAAGRLIFAKLKDL